MIVLITGGTGFIGRILVRKLVEDGNNVIILTRDKKKINSSLKEKVKILEADICDSVSLESVGLRLQGIDVIIHLSACLDYFGDKKGLFRVNVQGTINLLNWAEKNGIKRVIFASSIEAMGMVGKDDIPANETFECKPVSTYGESKLEAEKQVRKFAEVSSLNITILRLGNVYGPGSLAFIVPIANAILTHGSLLKFLPVYKDRYLHPGYIDDIVDGIIKSAQNTAMGKTYIISGEEYVSIKRLFELVAQGLNVQVDLDAKEDMKDMLFLYLRKKLHAICKRADLITYFMSGAGDRIHRAYSIETAKKELDYQPKINLREGISKTLAWAKKEGFLAK